MKNLETIKQSHDLRSAYALWIEDHKAQYYDEISATRFLLWYATFRGGDDHNPIIDNRIYEALSEPKFPYLTQLELYVAGINNKLVDDTASIEEIRDLHKWYYTDAIFKYKLASYLCEAEVHALARISSRYGGSEIILSLLDEIIYENNDFAKITFNLDLRTDIRQFFSWKARASLLDTAPWMPYRSGNEVIDPNSGAVFAGSQISLEDSDGFCGINIIGFASAILGLGEDLHSFASIAKRIGANIAVVDIRLSDRHATTRINHDEALVCNKPIFPINLFCMPLFETERFRLRNGSDCMRGRYNIGKWAWELSTLPEYWHHAFEYMDEIWAISPFLQEAYSKITTKPVYYVPPHVRIDDVERFDLSEFGLDDSRFVFLSLCDFNSHSARKNPVGSVKAFQLAFPSRRSDERLIVKTLNGHSKPDELDDLIRHIDDDPRVIVVDGPFSRGRTLGLIAEVDCYVSLHRSEGFGRVLAEAMLLRTPVIGTAYSGSNVLLDKTTGFPVDYHLTPIRRGAYPYAEGCAWAEPHLDSAIDQMRSVARNTGETSVRLEEGYKRVSENHGSPAVAKTIRDRLSRIRID